MKDSFVFYKSFYEAIKNIPKENQLDLYNAIFEYSFTNQEPKLEGITKAMFMLIKPNIDSANARYQSRVENGKKGGRPKKENLKKPNNNLNETKTKPNTNLNEDDNEDDNVNEDVDDYDNYNKFVSKNWQTLTPFEYETLKNYCSSSGEDIVVLAIQEAIKNKKKTLKYVEGILKNWKNNNLNTLEEIEENDIKKEKEKKWWEEDE